MTGLADGHDGIRGCSSIEIGTIVHGVPINDSGRSLATASRHDGLLEPSAFMVSFVASLFLRSPQRLR